MNNNPLVPRYAFLIKGKGEHQDRLQAFDIALREAGPLVHNLVSVSSILPAGCKIISREEGIAMLEPGQITFCVMARQESNMPSEKIAAAIGLAQLRDREHYGFISEHHATGQTLEEASRYAEELAVQMFSLKLGLAAEGVPLIQSTNCTEVAEVSTSGTWTSVVALCVFVL